LNSKYPKELQFSRFDCLAKVLRENPYYQQMIEILLTFGDFERFKSLFCLINVIDINRFKLVAILSNKLIKARDKTSKNFFASLLYKSLKSLPDIDLKSRLKQFQIQSLSEAKCDGIKTLFNQITNDDNSQLIKELSEELLIGN
jgi:hypothetical protein